jgi:hypothetical protein
MARDPSQHFHKARRTERVKSPLNELFERWFATEDTRSLSSESTRNLFPVVIAVGADINRYTPRSSRDVGPRRGIGIARPDGARAFFEP